jgi:Glycosyl transferases group 1
MRQELGQQTQAKVLYPIPARRSSLPPFTPPHSPSNRPLRVVYLGVLNGHHGSSLQDLTRALIKQPDASFQLELHGSASDWSGELVDSARSCGFYQGEQYGEGVIESILGKADVFLVVMSFAASQRRFVRTSFPSKILEYAAYRKPIIAWGPEDCSAVQFLRKYKAGLVVTNPDPKALIACASNLSQDLAQQIQLSQAFAQLARTVFDPQNIHQQFLGSMQQVLTSKQAEGDKVSLYEN